MRKLIILENTSYQKKKLIHHKINNKFPIEYIVDEAIEADVDYIYLASQFESDFGDTLKGKVSLLTPYDCISLKDEVVNNTKDEDVILIVRADTPLLTKNIIAELFDDHERNRYEISMPNMKKEAIRDGLRPVAFVLNGTTLKEAFNADEACLFHLTDFIRKSFYSGFIIGETEIADKDSLLLVNDFVDLEKATRLMNRRINTGHMLNGVIIENIDNVVIEKGVKIGKSTVIESGTRIYGDTIIGENCRIGFNTKIIDSKIYDNVDIESSYIEKSIVERYTNIGPYARLRPNAHLKENVHIGNFVEVKNSTVGEGTKAGHLTYIGDSDLGKDINIGCGVVFVNYDGKFKHRSVVDDRAFIGSNANIVAPVHVEEDGYVAAGSTITSDVLKGNLAIERAERKDVDGYVEKKRERDAKRSKDLGK